MKWHYRIRTHIAIIVISLAPVCAMGQDVLPDSGFTNKADAKNLLLNGLKEGKWVEYYANTGDTTQPFYQLTYYHLGKPYGIVRYYYNDGIMYLEVPFKKGKENGISKEYNWYGAVIREMPYLDGKRNGIEKLYKASTLWRETLYLNDTAKSIIFDNEFLNEYEGRGFFQ